MIYTRLLLLVFLLPLIAYGQGTSNEKWLSYSEKNAAIMKQNIRELKDGALLVRLMTKENSINALRENGRTDLADRVEQAQRKYNKEIISAFRQYFDFCPVYFFLSPYSDLVRNKQLSEVQFLNDSLEPDPSINPATTNFLTAEFGYIEQDTASYYDGPYYYCNENGLEKRRACYGSANTSFTALIIKSDQFIQLKRPFPYYLRTYNDWPLKRKLTTVVRMMNDKLFNYFQEIGIGRRSS
jgi:hypothetical protein